MNEVIYLEADVEITRVIEKIKAAKSEGVVLALPRDSGLAHSVVNLKLLKRTAESIGRFIIIAANDKVARNLVTQVGLPFYNKVSDAEVAKHKIEPKVEKKYEKPVVDDEIDDYGADPDLKSSIKVKTYNRFGVDGNVDDLDEGEADELDVTEEGANEDEIDEEPTFETSDIKAKGVDPKEVKKSNIVVDEDEEEKEQKIKIDREINQTLSRKDDEREIVISSKDRRENQPAEIKPPSVSIKLPAKGKNPRKLPYIITAIALGVVLILGAAYYAFIPYMMVSMVVKTDNFENKSDVTVNRSTREVNLKDLVIPGQIIENTKEETQKFTATGQKDIGDKATGVVSIFNLTSDELGLAAGTKITTTSGKAYLLQAAVKVPKATQYTQISQCKTVGNLLDCNAPGSVSDQKVTALETGESYNLTTAAGTMTMGGFSSLKLYAQNSAGFSGGTTKMATIVTAADLTGAEKTLTDSLKAKSKQELLDKAVADGVKLVDENVTQEVVSLTATKKADEEAPEFEYTIRVRSFNTGFKDGDLRTVVLSAANSAIESTKMIINPDKSQISYTVSESDSANGTAKLAVNFVGKIGQKIDENTIKTAIKNKKVDKIAEIIPTLAGPVESSEIKIWPTFMPYAPLLEKRIFVKFDYTEN